MKRAFIPSVSHSFTSCSLASVSLGFAVTLNLGFRGELYVHVYPAEDTMEQKKVSERVYDYSDQRKMSAFENAEFN